MHKDSTPGYTVLSEENKIQEISGARQKDFNHQFFQLRWIKGQFTRFWTLSRLSGNPVEDTLFYITTGKNSKQ